MAKSSRNNLQVAKRGKKFSKKLQPEEMVVLDERKKCMVVYQNGRQVVSRERESLAEAKGEFYYTKEDSQSATQKLSPGCKVTTTFERTLTEKMSGRELMDAVRAKLANQHQSHAHGPQLLTDY